MLLQHSSAACSPHRRNHQWQRQLAIRAQAGENLLTCEISSAWQCARHHSSAWHIEQMYCLL
jgi:hypothetical protein